MKTLTDIEKKTIIALIGCVKTMNVSSALYDNGKIAGCFLISGAEIQKILGMLEGISKKNKTAKALIAANLDQLPKPPISPILKEEVKKYTG